MMQQHFVTPWSCMTPMVFRMLEKTYVEQFFEDGSLRLSSFSQFAKHADEERLDAGEGRNTIVYRAPNNTVYTRTFHGSDALVLCATASEPPPALSDGFSTDSAIKIFDTTLFAQAITRQIPGVRAGYEGYCFYAKHIECKVTDEDVEALRRGENGQNPTFSGLFQFLANATQAFPFFRKDPSFQHQLEYRWVWIVDGPAPDFLMIKAAEARQFCLPWGSAESTARRI